MHQPYYKNLLTHETAAPWVRLHGTKDYLDMVKMLEKFPAINLTFNFVPSLIEQVLDYANGQIKDQWLELSYKPAAQLSAEDKRFILERFFSISRDNVICRSPRYFQLILKKEQNQEFNTQDFLDLQVWFNLSWIDPYFRKERPQLKAIVDKGRFYTEKEKKAVLDAQIGILKEIMPYYKKIVSNHQVEFTFTPFYHPILPLLYNTNIAREVNLRATLPNVQFSYPQDAKAQIQAAVDFFKEKFGFTAAGMWPSEEAVSEHVIPFMIQSGINWIVCDEGILFKSLKKKKRDTRLLYQPHVLKRKDGTLNVVFRDRNLSDLIGFTYYHLSAKDAVNNFMEHLKNINQSFNQQDILVTVAMDGENAWEYYLNDGHDFLEQLYQRLSESDFVKTITVKDYLASHPPKNQIRRISAGSWIYTDFFKWINNPFKNKAWEYLAQARKGLDDSKLQLDDAKRKLAYRQIYIAEGSDWFWWYGEKNRDFDSLFRMHLRNFYTLIEKEPPTYLNTPLE